MFIARSYNGLNIFLYPFYDSIATLHPPLSSQSSFFHCFIYTPCPISFRSSFFPSSFGIHSYTFLCFLPPFHLSNLSYLRCFDRFPLLWFVSYSSHWNSCKPMNVALVLPGLCVFMLLVRVVISQSCHLLIFSKSALFIHPTAPSIPFLYFRVSSWSIMNTRLKILVLYKYSIFTNSNFLA